ncbi:hypothetical protein [Gemmobacter serpentinus]|uniref:hypothetical protein n=1 Tax=Gemmobacter serpentinus TaxID=2652247 RepID=UPI00124DFF91|nr:hypothetical protein [Gemmobacter serpentinus]
MTKDPRSAQDILADQFRITADLSQLTGTYHRLLQRQAATAFARQMLEDRPGPGASNPGLAEAEAAEAFARQEASAMEARIADLERHLAALGHELAALK